MALLFRCQKVVHCRTQVLQVQDCHDHAMHYSIQRYVEIAHNVNWWDDYIDASSSKIVEVFVRVADRSYLVQDWIDMGR